MKPLIATSALVAALAATLATGGCATPESTVAGPNRAVATGDTKDDTKMTGSRIARRDSDRSVRGVNNSSFRQDNDIRSIHDDPNIGRTSN